MTISSPSIMLDQSTNANFRAWTSAVSNALIAVGLVRTADTGQIDFATTVIPGGGNQFSGYEIFRFNDALQSTRPVVIRIEYAAGNPATLPGLFITVGTSTNGAGVINSQLQYTRRHLTVGQTLNFQTCYFSGDGSYVNMIWPLASQQLLVSVERTRNPDGTANGNGILVFTHSGSSIGQAAFLSTINLSTGTSAGAVESFAYPGPGFGTATVGADTFFFPRTVALPKQEYDLAIMTGYTADVVNLIPISVENCGSPRTYLPWTVFNPANAGVMATLMRYE